VENYIHHRVKSIKAHGCSDECMKRLSLSYQQRFPDYYDELLGIYDVLKLVNMTLPELIATQSEYELVILALNGNKYYDKEAEELQLPFAGPGCTSVLTCNSKNNLLHGRNLDWGESRFYASTMFRVNFTRNGQLLFQSDQLPGNVGILTGVRAGGFSMSINARRITKNPNLDQFLNCMDVVPLQPALTGMRYYIENFKSYDEIYQNITTNPYCAPRYSIIGGINGKGARFQHNITEPYESYTANVLKEEIQCTDNSWFVAQCNSDIDYPRSKDTRRDIVMGELENAGRDYGSTPTGLFHAMTAPKVKNEKTIHTSIMSPDNGSLVTVAYDV